MHRLTSLVATAAAAVLALAACGGDDARTDTTATRPSDTTPSTDSPGGNVPAEIAGVHWIFDGFYTVGGLQPLPVTDSGAGLTITADGTVTIDTGCNQGSGMATFEGDRVRVSPITVTEKACLDAHLMQIERMLLGALEDEKSWGAGDGRLTLSTPRVSDNGLRFHDAANPPTDNTTVPPTDGTDATPATTEPTDRPTTVAPSDTAVPAELVGVEWLLDGHFTIGGLQPLPATGTGAGLTIAADGTVTLHGGCNQGSATATFDDEQVQFSDIIATAKACTDEGVMQVEQMLFGQLAEPQHWYVEGRTLQLTAVNVSDTGLHFRDASKPPADDASGDTIAPPHT
jgi:heat shock protein HslJ